MRFKLFTNISQMNMFLLAYFPVDQNAIIYSQWKSYASEYGNTKAIDIVAHDLK